MSLSSSEKQPYTVGQNESSLLPPLYTVHLRLAAGAKMLCEVRRGELQDISREQFLSSAVANKPSPYQLKLSIGLLYLLLQTRANVTVCLLAKPPTNHLLTSGVICNSVQRK